MKKLDTFAYAVLSDRYLSEGESVIERFRSICDTYAKFKKFDSVTNEILSKPDEDFSNRMYEYMTNLWFMPSTPILSNGGNTRGLPISCYLNNVGDNLEDIFNTWRNFGWLGALGGGIGTCLSDLRGAGEPVGNRGVSSGIIPFIKVFDSCTLAVSQGSLRRGAAACYLDISHPEIEEFLEIRKPSGDFNRKSLNIHHGITIPDTFMEALISGSTWDLVDPKSHKVIKSVNARELFAKILEIRLTTGEPYLVFLDTINKALPDHHRKLELEIKQSNLCSEIMLPTGRDYVDRERTAVCCLGSVNVEYFDEWCNHPHFIHDCLTFLRNVIDDFVTKTSNGSKQGFEAANYSASQEHSIGLGAMGLHSYFQSRAIPFDCSEAEQLNEKIFSHIREKADIFNNMVIKAKSLSYAFPGKYRLEEKEACKDSIYANKDVADDNPEADITLKKCSYMLAIAPTANISIIAGGCSPCIEPWSSNCFTHKTLSGNFEVKNKYLEKVLAKYASEGIDISDVWEKIIRDGGSVRKLDFLSNLEKEVFKTAFEVDQNQIIKMAGDRAKYIDQGQSINLFLHSDIDKKELLTLHYNAWKCGIKSLYYLRSKSLQRAGFSGSVEADNKLARDKVFAHSTNRDGEECSVCQ